MKWIKPLIFFSFCFGSFYHIPLKALETIEMVFDETTTQDYFLDQTIKSTSSKKMQIENIGQQPIRGVSPRNNHQGYFTKEYLAHFLKKYPHPASQLYLFWKKALENPAKEILQQEVEFSHPLDFLNFSEGSTTEIGNHHFLNLCRFLGMKVRLANVYNKQIVDVAFKKQYWECINLSDGVIYSNLNNHSFVSSEDIADDPFLALRVKSSSKEFPFALENNWENVAHFAILEPASGEPYKASMTAIDHPLGFDLYPQEKLDIDFSHGFTHHSVLMEMRTNGDHSVYESPVPLVSILNQGKAPIEILGAQQLLQPGETYHFDAPTFRVYFSFPHSEEASLCFKGKIAQRILPKLENGQNHIFVADFNPTQLKVTYFFETEQQATEVLPPPQVINTPSLFDHISPSFEVDTDQNAFVWWQISADPSFEFVPSNLERLEKNPRKITLDAISETWMNSREPYYFRVKSSKNGIDWSDWSEVFAFEVLKPQSVIEVDFDQIGKNLYTLNWERFAEESESPIEYLVFGSNSLDFVPSVYCSQQVNRIEKGIVRESEVNDNLVTIVQKPKVEVKGDLAYYRIIARRKGQLSNPSEIIRVYDQGLIQPRNVLQWISTNEKGITAKRTLFPASASSPEVSFLPLSSNIQRMDPRFHFNELLRSQIPLNILGSSLSCPQHVEQEAWEAVQGYLMPDNHPCKPTLDRLASKVRFIQNPQTMKRSGFSRGERVGHWSRVCASPHVDMPKYYFKVYCDNEIYIKYDWKRWIHRCQGAKLIDQCIKRNNLQSLFKVPRKWIYCLPKDPSPPNNENYLRKNFILVCDNMRICDHSENEKKYKKNMDRTRLEGMYRILQECGLYDSVYCFNMPFNKEGYICIIDTEYWHKWPVPFDRLLKCFSKENKKYWEKITKSGKIPNGINSPDNLPRNDRRDLSLMKKKP